MSTKICSHCRSHINQWANTCPYCTKPVDIQGNAPGTPAPFLGLQVIIVVIFALWIIYTGLFG